MRDPDGAPLGIVEQDRDAIGEAHDQRHATPIRDHAIGLCQPPSLRRRLIDRDARRAMHLPDRTSALAIHAERLVNLLEVCAHMLRLIANCTTDVQGGEGRLAAAAQARENAVLQG